MRNPAPWRTEVIADFIAVALILAFMALAVGSGAYTHSLLG